MVFISGVVSTMVRKWAHRNSAVMLSMGVKDEVRLGDGFKSVFPLCLVPVEGAQG